MKIALNTTDHINLVRATSPPLEDCAEWEKRGLGVMAGGGHGSPHWEWNLLHLKMLTQKSLWDIYQACKTASINGDLQKSTYHQC